MATPIRDLTVADLTRLGAREMAADSALQMDEETFRAVYERTARPLWTYLARMTGDRQLADDLLQDTYYRFLRAHGTYENEVHRRNALFRIATNLVHDARRRRLHWPMRDDNDAALSAVDDGTDVAGDTERRTDLSRAMKQLKPRERTLLWLAYAEGSSHREIAGIVGVQIASVKLMLFRARRKLAALLGTGERHDTD